MRFFAPFLAVVAFASSAQAEDRLPAYRVGSGTIRVALMPVRCARDMPAELCGAIDASLGVELGRDPRLDILAPHDLEILVGAQQLSAMQSCEDDSCFDMTKFDQVGSAYLVAVVVGRIGSDALITARIVDMRRGTVLDRDDARVSRNNEGNIDLATRELVQTMLARRGIGTPLLLAEDDGPSGLFVAGAVLAGVGGAALLGGGGLGGLAMFEASALERAAVVDKATFDAGADKARSYALGADLGLATGGVLALTGAVLMIAGSF